MSVGPRMVYGHGSQYSVRDGFERKKPKGRGRLRRMQVLSVKEAEFSQECIADNEQKAQEGSPHPEKQVLSLPTFVLGGG